MEVQLNSYTSDYTIAFVLLGLAALSLVAAITGTLWHKTKACEEASMKTCYRYEIAELVLYTAFAFALIAAAVSAVCIAGMSFDKKYQQAIESIETEYGFTFDSEQKKMMKEALGGYHVKESFGVSKNPYQEPVKLGDVWIACDDGSMVKGNFSFVLKKTDDENTVIFDLMIPNEQGDTLTRLSPEMIRAQVSSTPTEADVSSAFEKTDSSGTISAETDDSN